MLALPCRIRKLGCQTELFTMSAPQSRALDAIALQLAAALDRYDQDVGRMMESWPDLDLYREVSDQIERIRMFSSALPEARVQWVELLVAHAELIHFLWREKYGEGRAGREAIAAVRGHHGDAIAALRHRSLRLAARPG